MKIFTFGASLRKDSLNKKLIRLAVSLIQNVKDIEINHVDFANFRMPLYDGDLEASDGLPENAKKMIQAIHKADALIISAPEYNGSVSGTFKNAIDWISRDPSSPLNKKFLLLMAASPSNFGGIRGLPYNKIPFEMLGTHVYPKTFIVPQAHEAFDVEEKLKDAAAQERLQSLLKEYIEFVQAYLSAS